MRRAFASLAAGLILVAVLPSRVVAAPTPTPAPGSAPSGPKTPAPAPGPGPGPPDGCQQSHDGPDRPAVEWCFPWAYWDAAKSNDSTGWRVVCSRAGRDDKDRCAAAALTLDTPPADGTASVFDGGQRAGPGGTADKPKVHCEWFGKRAEQDKDKADRWKVKQDQCNQLESYFLTKTFVHPAPPEPGCGVGEWKCEIDKTVKEALAQGVRSGVQGLVDVIVQSMSSLLGKLADYIFTTATFQPTDAFYSIYNQISGVLIGLVMLFFLFSVIINGMRMSGPGPVATLGGLVRAFLGITFAGGIAWTMTALWDQATTALIDANAATSLQAGDWVKGITALAGPDATLFLALVVALFAVLGLILLLIMMLFRSLLVVGAALFGAMAMAGQVMPETRSWGRKWFWTVNALASSKFFMAAIWIYGSRVAYEAKSGSAVPDQDSFVISLQGLLMIWLMVLAPGILLRLTTMWDGYLSDVNARGVLSAAGDAANIGDRVGKPGGGEGKGGSSPADIMKSNSSEIPTNPTQGMDDVGDPAGLDGGPGAEAGAAAGDLGKEHPDGGADAAGEGGAVGEGHDDGGHPNANEAEGMQSASDSARHDLGAGGLAPPEGPGGGDGPPGGGDGGAGGGGDPTGGGDGGGPHGGGGGGSGGGGSAGGGGAAAGGADASELAVAAL